MRTGGPPAPAPAGGGGRAPPGGGGGGPAGGGGPLQVTDQPAFSMLRPTTSIVAANSSVGLNSTTSVPAKIVGV